MFTISVGTKVRNLKTGRSGTGYKRETVWPNGMVPVLCNGKKDLWPVELVRKVIHNREVK